MSDMKTDQETLERRARGRRNRCDGEQAQLITMEFMSQLGYLCIERIETGFTLKRKDGQIVGAFPSAKVSGDVRAIGPRGVTIHCECKYRPADRLKWSDFEEHQLEHLEAVTKAGGWAFVSWVTSLYPARLYWLQWPFPLRKGRTLTSDEAGKIRVEHFGFQNPNGK
jgi:hypothetical protein